MKGTATYRVIVDGQKITEFTALTTLTECQIDSIAWDYAQKWGLRNFGLNGVQVKRVSDGV